MGKSREEETKNRINEIVNTVDKFTRTERHLEQNKDIISEKQLKHLNDIQTNRVEHIIDLSNKISYGENEAAKCSEKDNLEENYRKTEAYINNNSEHMNKEDLYNLKERQEHRREKMDELSLR